MNNRQILAIAAGMLSLVTGIFAVRVFWFSAEPPLDEPVPPLPLQQPYESTLSGKRLSGPFAHKNLTVYLVHGEDTLEGETPLILDEAMGRGLVIVHETGDVNELAVENVSNGEEVFIQAGDIVKGGQQDRVLAVDLIVPARSGRMPIDSFCVEQGRWTARGGESSTRFNSGEGGGGGGRYVASKDLKIAAKHSKSQGEVWDKVAQSQEKLSAATNTNTSSAASRSSLPLTLENREVDADSGEYVNSLLNIVECGPDAIGFVMVINGGINSSDTYGSAALFRKLWPKLLKAAAIEALAESAEVDSPENTVTAVGIASFFESSEKAPVAEKRTITNRIRTVTRESASSVFLETLDRGTMLHRNYILK